MLKPIVKGIIKFNNRIVLVNRAFPSIVSNLNQSICTELQKGIKLQTGLYINEFEIINLIPKDDTVLIYLLAKDVDFVDEALLENQELSCDEDREIYNKLIE